MKILHTSDWHIGQTLYAKKRGEEHGRFLAWLRDTIVARGIGALIVAGDVFDTGAPGGAAQRLYYDFLTSLLGTCCGTVVVIAGNHDSPAMLEAPAGVLEMLHIHTVGLAGYAERCVIPLRGTDGQIAALCCAVPYLRRSDMSRADDELTTDDKILRATARVYAEAAEAAQRARLRYGGVPVVATGHLFAAGASRSDGDGVRELYVGSLGQIGADIFSELFSYVALGHIHGAQCVAGQERIRYSGSPLPMSFSEAGTKKTVLEVTLGESLAVSEITVPCFQRLARVAGVREEIMAQLCELGGEDVWIEVTHTGDAICAHLTADVYEAVKDKRAQVLSVRDTAVMKSALGAAGPAETLETLSVQEVFLRCMRENGYGGDQQRGMIECFNEIISSLEEEAACE
jgi:exonuclease SbcD